MLRWKITGLLVLSILCWELLVRLFVLSPAQEIFVPDLGYAHTPYAHILRTYEGYARFELDEFGLNNDPLPKEFAEKHVLVVGDSFVESYQVMRKENFLSHLQMKWRDSYLFNAGGSGAAPDLYVGTYTRLKDTLLPHYVLLCVNASDLYELLGAKEVRDEDGFLQGLYRDIDEYNSFKAVKLWVYAHSALVTHLKWKYEDMIRSWFTGHSDRAEMRKHHALGGKRLAQAIERWRFVLHSFQQQDVKLTVLMMPELEYLPHQHARKKVRQGRSVLMDEARAMGVPVLDSNPIFTADFERSGQPAIGFANTHYGKGHINAYGHQVLANWLNAQRAVILR